MSNNQFIASVHNDYLPFVALATDEELGQFVRAQILQSSGDELPELTGIAKALYDAHSALAERLEEAKRKKSEAGKLGGNPQLKQCLSSDKAEDKPVSITNTITTTVTEDKAVAVDAREPEISDFAKIAEHFAKTFGYFLPSKAQVSIQGYLDHMCADVIIDAIDKADDPAVERKWPYIDSVLAPRKAAGIKTMDDVRRIDDARATSKAAKDRGWRKSGGQTPAEHPKAPDAAELARMEKILEQMQGDDTS